MTIDLSVVNAKAQRRKDAKGSTEVSPSDADVVGAFVAEQKLMIADGYGKFHSKSPGITPFYALSRFVVNARGPRVAESKAKVCKAGMRTWLSALLRSGGGHAKVEIRETHGIKWNGDGWRIRLNAGGCGYLRINAVIFLNFFMSDLLFEMVTLRRDPEPGALSCGSVAISPLTFFQWLPKPANSQLLQKRRALRATWSPLRGEDTRRGARLRLFHIDTPPFLD